MIYLVLLRKSVDQKFRKGITSDISQKFVVSTRTITCIWRHSKNTVNGVIDFSHRKNTQRIEFDREKSREIPLSQITCIWYIACAMDISKSTVHRHRQSGEGDTPIQSNHCWRSITSEPEFSFFFQCLIKVIYTIMLYLKACIMWSTLMKNGFTLAKKWRNFIFYPSNWSQSEL